MGDIGNFFLGGSKSKQGSDQQSGSTSTSSNASQQGSISNSANRSSQTSASGNQAYAPIAGAMSPTLGYTASGGNMLGALLGLPGYSPTSAPAPAVAPTAAPLPTQGGGGGGGGNGNVAQMISQLEAMFKTTPAPKATPSPIPAATPPIYSNPAGNSGTASTGHNYMPVLADRREMGGPVQANKPYVVGEKRPELFVPHTDGHIVPQVPQGGMINTMLGHPTKPDHGHGMPGGGVPPVVPPVTPPGVPPVTPPATPPVTPPVQLQSALDTWANSAGMNFLRDQGTQAIANTGAANGTFQSGATGKALEKFGVGLASTYQNDYINHLLDFAKLGLGGASAMSGAGGVSASQGTSSGNSGSVSMGNSSGSSTGTSSSTGSSTGSANSKKGLVPDILG